MSRIYTTFTELRDSEDFPKVSSQTRTDILGVLELELDPTVGTTGELDREELVKGIRHLLMENENGKKLMNARKSDSPAINNIFYFSDQVGEGCMEGALHGGVGSIFVWVSLVFCSAFVCNWYGLLGSLKTASSEESSITKTLKVIFSLGPSLVLGFWIYGLLTTLFEEQMQPVPQSVSPNVSPIMDSALSTTFSIVVRFLASFGAQGAVYGGLSSLFAKYPCIPSQSRDVEQGLYVMPKHVEEALGNVKRLLITGWERNGDDLEQCKDFTHYAIILHLAKLSGTDNTHEHNVSNTPSPNSNDTDERSLLLTK